MPDTRTEHTPGPWGWFGNANSHSLYLATKHSGRRYVMGFKRWGFSGGQPEFQPGGRGMVDASELLQFEVGDRDVVGVEAARKNTSVYRMDVRGIDCADARLIAAAPCLLSALETARAALHQHYIDWDGEREDAVPLQEARAACDAAIAKARGEA
ncbi:hypothetical protein EDF56_101189 [Novosphingobium sp. PhB165]|uniref:hypothetical protein n=1 Tax=Novosphingobium sp. PhB165 TaxID=2485105 RepID=UPI00104F1983|nr:hypothetical protein [Novosphingobium sp. PhB165]TCM21525.1 hypothetical protein EDF56_101189 [Novosphingobium sp. PhB165]